MFILLRELIIIFETTHVKLNPTTAEFCYFFKGSNSVLENITDSQKWIATCTGVVKQKLWYYSLPMAYNQDKWYMYNDDVYI